MTSLSDRKWLVDVVVMPKAGVNDPEGEAILGGLKSLGYGEVGRVRSGKMIRIEVAASDEEAAKSRASEMADRLLANPVIESFEVVVAGEATSEASR